MTENVLPSRFVLAVKHAASGETKLKAIFVLDGHKDTMKHKMVQTTSTLGQISVRMILALAEIFGFSVWTEDVKQAYLQSAALLQRHLFLKPNELELGPNEFLQLLIPLYGLCEARFYWNETLTDHCLYQAQFEQAPGDLSIFFRRLGHSLCGFLGNYVDDLPRAASPGHRAEMEQVLRSQFEVDEATELPTDFLGLNLPRDDAELHAAMTSYIKRLHFLPENASYEDYVALRASLLLVANARPDVFAFASLSSSVRSKSFSPDCVQTMTEKLKYLKETSDVKLTFPKLELTSLRLVVYSDASFANRADKSPQIGYIICLADASGRICVLSYRSCKSTRVCRSAMAAETLAFTAAFDATYVVRHHLQIVLQQSVPLLRITDSKSLFDVLTSNRTTTEGRLMIDLFAARQAYSRKDIDNVGLLRSEDNIADDLTKFDGNGKLLTALQSGILDHDVVDYILC